MDTKEKNSLIIHKNAGKFYNAYNIDAYILQYLFGYKVLSNKKCGFPDTSYNKVINKLHDLKISYKIIYTDKEPVIHNFKDNNYKKYCKIAIDNIDYNNKIDFIIKKIESASKEKIDKIVKLIIECLS